MLRGIRLSSRVAELGKFPLRYGVRSTSVLYCVAADGLEDCGRKISHVTELVSDRMEVWGGGAKGDLSAQVAGSCSDLVPSWLQQHAVCHRVVSLPAWIRHQTGGGKVSLPQN